MNQAEYRSRAAEIREAELVLLATPSEQAHFGEGGEVFARCYGMVRSRGGGLPSRPSRGVQPVSAPRRSEAVRPGRLGARPGGWGSAVGAARC